MSKFKDVIIDVIEMHEDGFAIAEIGQRYALCPSMVEYVIDTYGPGLYSDEQLVAMT
jgi:hypothetical protein